ncbi:MAG: hypothetical protein LBG70_04440, partial [Bifidobacteriaceae bacterium]|nr:hypothetical protein [Bifidobacteriaceae bacterium]
MSCLRLILAVLISFALAMPISAAAGPAHLSQINNLADTSVQHDRAKVTADFANAKVRRPKLKTIRSNGRVPSGVRFALRKPSLQGSTLRNRSAFAFQVEQMVSSELANQARAKRYCLKIPRLKLTATTKGSIYLGRYASVVMIFKGVWCGGKPYRNARSFTLDLKRSKLVTLDQLSPNGTDLLDWQIIEKLYQTTAYTSGKLGPKGSTLVPRSFSNNTARGWTRM